MASLYLVRHGQASFLKENYDQLSPIGHQQAEVLGTYFQNKGIQFDFAWHGTLVRHRETYEGMKRNHPSIPNAQVFQGFNEHQATEIYELNRKDLLKGDEALQKLMEEKGKDDPGVRKGFIKHFFKAIKMWANGEIDNMGHESYEAFTERVKGAYNLLTEQMKNYENALVVTSGGTIGMLMGLLLDLNSEKIIELNWQTRNTGVTELRFSQGKFFLHSFNEIPHLSDKSEWITYV